LFIFFTARDNEEVNQATSKSSFIKQNPPKHLSLVEQKAE